MKPSKYHSGFIPLMAALAFLPGCGSDPVSSTTSAGTSGYPSGMAIASLFASGSNTSLRLLANEAVDPTAQALNSSASFTQKAEALQSVIEAASAADCQVMLPSLPNQQNIDCYGPSLNYLDHADFTSGGNEDGQLPTGDLGIWTSTHTTGEACTAGKINSLVKGISGRMDVALLFNASLYCVMKTSGQSLPAANETLDLTTAFNTAIQAKNASASVSSATIARVADVGGLPVYVYSIAANLGGTPSTSLSLNMKHQDVDVANNLYKGKIWGYTTTTGVGGEVFSLVYNRNSSTDLKYQLQTGTVNSGTTMPDLFASDGSLVYTNTVKSSYFGNLHNTVSNYNPDTGLGSIAYAWSAGTNDGNTRVFNAFTKTNTSGQTEGCGFFSYGSAITWNSTASAGFPSTIGLDTFICNWAGPGNSHTGLTGKAQKQCMTRNSTSGEFEVDGARENITYAPVNTCSYNPDGSTHPGKTTFTYATGTPGAPAAVTHNLVTLSSDADYANYTAPTAPTDPF